MSWKVYIVRCRDGSLYTGISQAVEARVARHNAGHGAKYTRARRPVQLVWCQSGLTHRQAAQLERQIKRLKRKHKDELLKQRYRWSVDAACWMRGFNTTVVGFPAS